MVRAEAEGTGGRPQGGARNWLRGQLRNIAPFITLLALVAFFGLATPSFLTLGNLNNILTQISITGIMAAPSKKPAVEKVSPKLKETNQ